MRAFIALLFVAVATAELAPLLENAEPIPGSYIIKLKDGFDVNDIASTVRLSGGRVSVIFKHVLHGFAAELSDKVLDIVRRLPAVEYVEQDGVYRSQAVSSWGLDRIDQRDLPLDDNYSPSGTGSEYTVYVLDTGVLEHSDFGGRAHQKVSYAFGGNQDCNGHGTHCAGTVGSTTYGVAKGVEIIGVKVLGCLGSGSTSGISQGCDYVITHAQENNRKGIASMSLGGGASQTLDDAVKRMIDAGIPTAVAAGNSNVDAENTSPARLAEAITVGATDRSDVRSSFSNYGSSLDIFAPGTDITSWWEDGSFRTVSGTSMACPHVAGGIALYDGDTNAMIENATTDELYKNTIGSGSPNKLLYVS